MVEHNWLLYIAAFACAFAITLVTTPFAKWLSAKVGAIDYPKDRGVHKKPMPRMGGVAIVLGFLVTVLMVYFFDRSMSPKQFVGFIVGAGIIAVLGMIDDMKDLPAKLKFCVQIVAALIVIFSGTDSDCTVACNGNIAEIKYSHYAGVDRWGYQRGEPYRRSGRSGGRGNRHCGPEPHGAVHHDRYHHSGGTDSGSGWGVSGLLAP